MRKALISVFLFIVIPVLCSARRFSVKVVGISDGDTFTCINNDNLQLKIRIYGIDAPEKKQAFGNKSKEYLSSLIFGKAVIVNVQSQDSWGRHIAYVYTPNGNDEKPLGTNKITIERELWGCFDGTPKRYYIQVN